MSFPESPYVQVRARVASIWADGPDDGTHPDWRPAVGEKVTLNPSIGSQLLTYDVTGPEPIIVTVERVECVVDEDGWLTKEDGRPVFIAPTDDPLLSATGWTWTATIKGKSIAFSALAGGVVDLALYVATPAVDAVERLSVAQVAAEYVALHHEELVGEPGREVELQTSATHIQWRYEGDEAWTDLIPLVTITGPEGPSVELQTTATHIQWRLVGGDWADLVALSTLVGPAGPPNELSIGTVTTGEPGSAAAASISGAAPEQVLDLTIPTGATGAVSAWEYYAAGRPDVVGTLDADALAWRNAAPSGATFYSTDGPQGAWVWRKRGATWECVEGDTGDQWVALAVPLAAGGQFGFGARVRRDASTASLMLNYSSEVISPPQNAVHTVGDTPTWALPAVGGTIAIIGTTLGGGDLQDGTSFMSVGATIKMRFGFNLRPWGETTYRTSGAWPTSFAITSLPDGVTSIGASAFNGCSSLALTSLPAGVTYIGDRAFSGCTSLALTSLPAGVTSIGSSAFRDCTSLALTSLPEGVTSIGGFAFYGCTSLALTSLPAGVTSIGNYAFNGCSSLVSMEIHEPIETMGSDVFRDCHALTSLTIHATTPPTLGARLLLNSPLAQIYVPAASVDAYKAAAGWSTYADRIQAI